VLTCKGKVEHFSTLAALHIFAQYLFILFIITFHSAVFSIVNSIIVYRFGSYIIIFKHTNQQAIQENI
jgi:uncharacterized membrane protein